MVVIADYSDNHNKNKIIMDDGQTLKYIGDIIAHKKVLRHSLYVVDKMEFSTIDSANSIHIPEAYKFSNIRMETIHGQIYPTSGGGVSTAKPSDAEFVKHAREYLGITIINSSEEDHYTKLIKLTDAINQLYNQNEVYETILENDEPVELVDILFKSSDPNIWIQKFLFASGNTQQLTIVAEDLLATYKSPKIYDPVTSEEQVAMFLDVSKQRQNQLNELVDDEFIDRMKNHEAYKFVTDKLQENEFALSKTQQFNSLQHAGLLLSPHTRHAKILYNLSDMGAGKTLMTVESIVFAQIINCDEFVSELNKSERKPDVLALPSINIIAPLLSLTSSWIDTFRIFLDIKQSDDSHYTYTIERGGYTFSGDIYLSGFTVKNGSLTVHSMLPAPPTTSYLIIDEIHQLLARNIRSTRFIDAPMTPNIYANYRTFVLSGTLANLSTAEWYRFIQFMSIPSNVWGLNASRASDVKASIEQHYKNIQSDLNNMAQSLETQQNRTLDELATTTQISVPKMTNKEIEFQIRYGAIQVSGDRLSSQLSNKVAELQPLGSVLPAINFELFYKLVGQSVVTAQSQQIAEELFGEQATQHKAQIIKTESPLTTNDVTLLKRLHKIVKDVSIYKSQAIARNLANAILNLNDGLQNKSIYELLNVSAAHNRKFLEYLTTTDVSLLEDLTKSQMIKLPTLEDTEKFKILKDLLEKEPDETFLIVVNTPEVAIQLAKALGIPSLTTKEMRNELNYQSAIDEFYQKHSVLIVPQSMIKSSLDIVQANRLIQYQLNTDIADIIQTQNRINRIGQTRETKAYYIATDILQENIINLFLETYRNIKVAHKGIAELFVDMDKQVDVVSDYLSNAFDAIGDQPTTESIPQPTVTVDGEVIEPILDTVNVLSDDVVKGVHYQNHILVQAPTGETLILANIQIPCPQPKVVTINIKRGELSA